MTARDIVMRRRREVLILHNAKYTAEEIGSHTGWNTEVIHKDIQWMQRQEEWKVKLGNPVMEILINFNQEYRDFIQLQKNTADDAVKKACISGRTKITREIKKLLQESNNMHKEPDKLDIRTMELTPDRVREILEAKKRRMIEDELVEPT